MNTYLFDSANECATLVEILRWRASRQPDQRAYTFLVDGETEEAHLTYAELDRRARAIAARLQSLGAAGERALLVCPPSLEYIAAFLGCLYAGVVAVPVYPPDPMRVERTLPRLLAIANDARPVVVLTTSLFLSMANDLLAREPILQGVQGLATDDIANDLAEAWRDPGIGDSTLAFLQYTSGSTAAPKGVMVSHGNILYNERMIQIAFGNTGQSTCVSWLPMYHDMGLLGNILQPLFLGAHCVLMSPFDFLQKPYRWLQALSKYRGYFSGAPNFAYDLCVRKIKPEQLASLDLSSWKKAYNGAEPVRHQILEQFAKTFEPCGLKREALYPVYGLAEATLFVSGGAPSSLPIFCAVQSAALEQNRVVATSMDDENARVLVGCGRTWLDQKIAIVDPIALTMCPADAVGEIWVSGPNVAQGYWNRPEETERVFRAYLADTGEGPFLRTGDLGFLKDGELFITGRIKDLIIVDGRNHYPQDIELTVDQSHPALRSGCCAAFSIDIENTERLVVVAEAKDSLPDIEQVVKTVRRSIAKHHDVQVHDILLLRPRTIPKTSSGKIQRHACRVGYLTGTLDMLSQEGIKSG
jgi:acyl-CoA synthetase (AMP-forming)/AMP-acid ligase II